VGGKKAQFEGEGHPCTADEQGRLTLKKKLSQHRNCEKGRGRKESTETGEKNGETVRPRRKYSLSGKQAGGKGKDESKAKKIGAID